MPSQSAVTKFRNRHFFILDLILLPLAAYFCYVLRLDRFDIDPHWNSFTIYASVAVIITPILFRFSGMYAQYWRYASVDELLTLVGAVIASVIISSLVAIVFVRFSPISVVIPRSIPFIFLLLALAVTATPRFLIRVFTRYGVGSRNRKQSISVIIAGAGDAGIMIVRELQRNPQLGMHVAAFVDDDPGKHDMKIQGVPVKGDRHAIPRVVNEHNAREVIIAMPTAPGKDIREVMEICERAEVEIKIIPGVYELLGGTVSVNQLRDVDINDLLRRDPIQTDVEAVGELIRGKRVLVTGGGGSIGSELCRQIWRFQPGQLILLGHGENSIFEIFNELTIELRKQTQTRPSPEQSEHDRILQPVIADIRFPDRVHSVFEKYRPEIVFHAAAHKHVPLMEANPNEAITNNVLGTRNLLDASLNIGVERFVMISTDKAVNPTSIMGVSKRAAELLLHQAAEKSGKPYVAVRFGNVLGSRGSVVLTFKRQIAAGGPITVTHPDMKRFFMTIPEAVQLVLQASVLGNGGEVFMLDMGEPLKIVDLARDLIELSGLEIERDIDIVFSGMRPGEKLYEEMFIEGESYQRTKHKKIYIAANASSFVPEDLDVSIDSLESAAMMHDQDAVIMNLRRLVPEFDPVGSSVMGNGKHAGAENGSKKTLHSALPVFESS